MSEKTYEDGYRDGYVAGYGAGTSDGRGQGYSDAKYRAHRAVDAADVDDHARRRLSDAMTQIVGKQS